MKKIAIVSMLAALLLLLLAVPALADSEYCPTCATATDVIKVTEPKTCTETGYHQETCKECGYIFQISYDYATGHTMKEYEIITPPTCTEAGSAVYKCTKCEKKETLPVDAVGHYWNYYTADMDYKNKPTCTTNGSAWLWCGNKNCDAELLYTYGDKVAKPNTVADQAGLDAMLKALGHTYTAKDVEAKTNYTKYTKETCTEAGLMVWECTRHGCKEKNELPIQPAGHKFGDWQVTKKATCTVDGQKERKCSVCGEKEYDIVKANGHKAIEGDKGEVVSEATCTKKGLIKYSKCAVCGKEFTDETAKELGHDMVAGEAVAPTCTEKGYTPYTCSRCGATENDNFVEAVGHAPKEETTPATCLVDGLTVTTCDRCGEKLSEEVILATGHTDGEWETVKAATYDEEGEKALKCAVCGETIKTEAIAKLEKPVKPADNGSEKHTSSTSGSGVEIPATGDNSIAWAYVMLIASAAVLAVAASKRYLFNK